MTRSDNFPRYDKEKGVVEWVIDENNAASMASLFGGQYQEKEMKWMVVLPMPQGINLYLTEGDTVRLFDDGNVDVVKAQL